MSILIGVCGVVTEYSMEGVVLVAADWVSLDDSVFSHKDCDADVVLVASTVKAVTLLFDVACEFVGVVSVFVRIKPVSSLVKGFEVLF